MGQRHAIRDGRLAGSENAKYLVAFHAIVIQNEGNLKLFDPKICVVRGIDRPFSRADILVLYTFQPQSRPVQRDTNLGLLQGRMWNLSS